MHPLFVLYAPPVYTTEWGAYLVSTKWIWEWIVRFSHLFFQQPNPYYKRIQKGSAHKFCLQDSLATKFYLQNGLAPKLYKTVWQPSSSYKTVQGLCHMQHYAPLVYATKWDAYPLCLQNGCGIDSMASKVVLPATKSLLQKDTKGFGT